MYSFLNCKLRRKLLILATAALTLGKQTKFTSVDTLLLERHNMGRCADGTMNADNDDENY
jgi:hypothetical protein